MQQQTRASSKPGSQPGQTNKFGGTNKAGLTGTIGAVKALHPEDDWELTANPSNYLDQLPQPFKFINTCLDLMILKPVFNKITQIEEHKKTPEYEGFLREVQATGFLDQEGITFLTQSAMTVGPGGVLEKEGYSFISNKVLVGDKFGNLILFDASRKLILDKKQLWGQIDTQTNQQGHPRRIQHISTCTLTWMDTKLTYVSVIARGSPIVKILAFKHNENKIYHLYNLNVCPTLANPDNLEMNVDQSYLELPSETKISMDFQFMSVTSFSGEVKLIKLPAIINPMRDDEPTQAPPSQTPAGKNQPAAQQQTLSVNLSQQNLNEEKFNLKSEIDTLHLQNLDLATHLILKIEARKEQKFKDPFTFKQYPEGATEEQIAQIDSQNNVIPVQLVHNQPAQQFKYLLGSMADRQKDQDGGDTGAICKKSKIYPVVNFVRSKYCSKPLSNGLDQAQTQQSKLVKEYFITTGMVIAYQGQFDVQVYNIQKASKERILGDFTLEYFNKLIMQKKLNAKKKQEKNLATLIRTVRQKEEAAVQQKTQQENSQNPIRNFKMPYQISQVAYQGNEDNFQVLAVGLIDGAILLVDLILGMERRFLEKHPAEISALAFWDDKVLISGSIDGRINLNDLEDEFQQQPGAVQNPMDPPETQRLSKCQNCQDRRIPIAKVYASSDYGVGVVVDIEGNCRFYDLIRFRKMAKVSSLNSRDSDARFVKNNCKWRLIPNIAMEVTNDVFLAVTQIPQTQQDEDHQKQQINTLTERSILVDNKYSDVREHLRSMNYIVNLEAQELPFHLQKSTLCIFRFEDVIFNLYPHLASMRRKGMTVKEIFLKNDPVKETQVGPSQTTQHANLTVGNLAATQHQLDMTSQKSHFADSKRLNPNKSMISGHSTKKSGEMLSVNFNLGNSSNVNDGQQQQQYDIPTLKRLNPELYKEYAKSQKQIMDPVFLSVKNLKERYSYHEMRQQRIQKRTEEVTKELEMKNEEQIMKNKKQKLKGTSNNMGTTQ
eukprot:403333237